VTSGSPLSEAALVAVLDKYADDLCEGYCEGSWDCANFDTAPPSSDCGGCLARRVAGQFRAQAIEARRAETGTGSVHESAVGSADAPESPSHD
jgi:hypothetical protein